MQIAKAAKHCGEGLGRRGFFSLYLLVCVCICAEIYDEKYTTILLYSISLVETSAPGEGKIERIQPDISSYFFSANSFLYDYYRGRKTLGNFGNLLHFTVVF